MTQGMELVVVTEPEILQVSVEHLETIDNFLTEVAQVEVITVERIDGETVELIVESQSAVEEIASTELELISESGSPLVEVVEVYAATGVPGAPGPAGPAGPAGPKGTYEDEPMFTRKVDVVSDAVIYKGEAAPGSTTSAPVWRIRRYTFGVDDDISEDWAGGTAEFDKVWDNRTGYSY